MLKRTVLDFEFEGDAMAVADAWAAKFGFAFEGDQAGGRLYYRDDRKLEDPRYQAPTQVMSSGLYVSIRQSGTAVHFEAWVAVTGLLRLFGQPEMRVAPGGFQGSAGRFVNQAPVDALLASLGQPRVSQPPVVMNPRFEPAGLGRRFAAVLIDLFIMLMLLVPVQAVAQAFGYDPATAHGSLPGTVIYPLGVVVVLFFWIPVWSAIRGSPGQLVLGMSLVDSETAGRLIAPTAWLRSTLWLLSVATVIPGLIMAFGTRRDPYQRSWLDRVTLTLVVKRKSIQAVPWQPTERGADVTAR